LQLGVEARTGKGVRVTHRAQVFNHTHDPARLIVGDHVVLDGTLEVYDRGRLSIGDYSFIGRSRIYASHDLTIGRWVYVSDGCAIMDSDLHPTNTDLRRATSEAWARGRRIDVYDRVSAASVSIGDSAWIGFGCVILKGVRIGEGAIVAAGSVVTSGVPDWTVVAGSPARAIRELAAEDRR
jgi:acetyltransferase-like isoleucine patch superfamily enzyme